MVFIEEPLPRLSDPVPMSATATSSRRRVPRQDISGGATSNRLQVGRPRIRGVSTQRFDSPDESINLTFPTPSFYYLTDIGIYASKFQKQSEAFLGLTRGSLELEGYFLQGSFRGRLNREHWRRRRGMWRRSALLARSKSLLLVF